VDDAAVFGIANFGDAQAGVVLTGPPIVSHPVSWTWPPLVG